MEYGKYIIKVVRGVEVAILFDPLISHDCIGTCRGDKGETVSAGFFSVMAEPTEEDPGNVSVGCWGKSVTLKMESRKEQDEPLVKRVVRKEW
jgi:hypothetical protein